MRVALFPTCVVDQVAPQIGRAMVTVLRRAGCELLFDPRQTCCGQPAFNSGFRAEARRVAAGLLQLFDDADYVVAPSGSCTTMCRVFYPELFAEDPALLSRVAALRGRLFEFSEFLLEVLQQDDHGSRFAGRVAYHDACHALRELRIHDGPRRLLRRVKDLELVEMDAAQACCGFGGTFSVKFGELSGAMARDKVGSIQRAGVAAVVSSDASCLLQLAGALSRAGLPVRTLHLAEVLAGV